VNLDQEERKLLKLKGPALLEKYRESVGSDTKSTNRAYLVRRILQALQAGAPPATPASKKEPRRSASKRPKRDPRLPAVGTILERELDGKMLKVKILDDGFRFGGRTFGSLSAVAKEATGTIWNGLLFWGLVKRKPRASV